MSLEVCTVSAIIYDTEGQPIPNARVTVIQVFKSGVLIMGGPKVYQADENGEVELTLPRDSSAVLRLPVDGGAQRDRDTVRVQIPDAASAALEELVSAASVPRNGLDVREAGVALPNKIGTFNFGEGFTIEETSPGVLSVEVAESDASLPQDLDTGDEPTFNGWSVMAEGKIVEFTFDLNSGSAQDLTPAVPTGKTFIATKAIITDATTDLSGEGSSITFTNSAGGLVLPSVSMNTVSTPSRVLCSALPTTGTGAYVKTVAGQTVRATYSSPYGSAETLKIHLFGFLY